MNKPLTIKVLVLAITVCFSASTQAQLASTDQDPILQRLDSLHALHFFKKHDKSDILKRKLPLDSVPKFSTSEIDKRMKDLDRRSPFNMKYNRSVDRYIRNYAERYRHETEKLLGLAELYFPMFEEKLDAYSIPLEMKYLPIVESALNPNARSQAGATGLWQFMYRTGKMYNLQVSSYIDDRKNPVKATEAACEYLSHLHDIYGDWLLVLAAYNAGPGNVNKAIRRSGGKMNYWDIRRFLPKETQGYVPAFMGVAYVMEFAEDHNIFARHLKDEFLNADSVMVTQHMHFSKISKKLEVPMAELRQLNPQYKLREIPASKNKPLPLYLPSTFAIKFVEMEAEIYGRKPMLATSVGMVTREIKKSHTVKSGEFLGVIARKYKVSVADIQKWNDMSTTKINPGQELTLFMVVNEPATISPLDATSIAQSKVKTTPGSYIYYTVQNGDTLWEIANKYPGISVEALRTLNVDINADKLQVGQVIKLHQTGT